METQRQKISEDRLANGRGTSELIPTELIIEIVSRLSAKFIARFRCVSKRWASIILSPYFTDLVLTRSATTRPHLLFAYVANGEIFFFSSLQPQNPDEKSSPITVDYHMCFSLDNDNGDDDGMFKAYDDALPSVNGLVCLEQIQISKGRKHTLLVICNPSTGQSLTLPRVKTRRVVVMSFFGYDPIGKQFKVLSMTRSNIGSNKFSREHQVLTLGNGKLSWRMIECNILPHCPLYDGTCIDGVLYYPARVKGFEEKFRIACFDIRSEKFKLIKENDKVVRGKLVNYKEKLATLRSDNKVGVVCERSTSFELCVLEDAEKHECSTHTYVLPPFPMDIVSRYGMYIQGVTRTGEIVLSSYSRTEPFHLVYYNLERKTIRKVEIQGIDDVFVTVSLYALKIHTFIDHVEDVRLGGVFQTS